MDEPQQTPASTPAPYTTTVTPAPAPTPSPAPVPFVPPVAATPTPVVTPPPSGSHTGLLVGILVIVILLAAAYFFFRSSGDVVVASPSPIVTVEPTVTETPSVTPTPTAIPPVGWKVYSDAPLGYAFQYPELWKLATGSFREVEGLQRLIKFTEVVPPNMTRTQSSFTVEQDYQNLATTRTQQVGKTETTMDISGKTAYKYTDTVNPDIFIFIASSALHIKLHVPNADMLQILSTFSLN